MNIIEYIHPELFALIPMLIIIGLFLKRAAFFDDRFIPITLGAIGIVVAVCYQFGDGDSNLYAGVTAVMQGIMCAGVAVYGNQIVKQLKKKKDTEDDDIYIDW